LKIVVCIKQVPDVPTVRMDRERMTIIREGVESVINPLDYIALEAALELRQKAGGHVCIITMGPVQSEVALREALAVGADQAILLTGSDFAGADTLATSHVLARAIQKLEFFPDLILCGMQTTDSDTGHVGPQIAEELGLPQVCGVNEIHREGNFLVVKRLSDGFVDTVRVTLPTLLTVTKGLCPVRDLPLGALEAAFSTKDVLQWNMADLDLKKEEIGFAGSATQVRQLRSPPPRGGGDIIEGPPDVLVDHLLQRLEALSILDEEDETK